MFHPSTLCFGNYGPINAPSSGRRELSTSDAARDLDHGSKILGSMGTVAQFHMREQGGVTRSTPFLTSSSGQCFNQKEVTAASVGFRMKNEEEHTSFCRGEEETALLLFRVTAASRTLRDDKIRNYEEECGEKRPLCPTNTDSF
jgi:hypothetical protein